MTKRDFELIAGVLDTQRAAAHARKDITSIVTLRAVATYMALALKDTNPRFDVDRFLSACGVKG